MSETAFLWCAYGYAGVSAALLVFSFYWRGRGDAEITLPIIILWPVLLCAIVVCLPPYALEQLGEHHRYRAWQKRNERATADPHPSKDHP